MSTPSRPRVFLDVNIGEEPIGRLTFELFADKASKTCENFRQLCTGERDGLSYSKAPFHRVIDEFMIQGGDIANGDGTGTVSIYGGEFDDENLGWREMDATGLLCSANRGRDTNGSQFFITLEPCPHLNGKHTIFGRVISGEAVLQKISKVEVDKNDRPADPVLVARCGELERRKGKSAKVPERLASPTEYNDRGRQRRSNSTDEEMVDTSRPHRKRASRRQSDNVVDEGLRGRPRQRSHSRSDSDALASTSDSQPESASEKHKRKRSPSPSRHANGHSDERRRRSLPNQYADNKRRFETGDENRYRPSPRRDYQRDKHTSYRPNDDRWIGRDGDWQHSDRDRYRPDRENSNPEEHRLDGYGDANEGGPPVKFKGRGIMKYREPDRAW